MTTLVSLDKNYQIEYFWNGDRAWRKIFAVVLLKCMSAKLATVLQLTVECYGNSHYVSMIQTGTWFEQAIVCSTGCNKIASPPVLSHVSIGGSGLLPESRDDCALRKWRRRTKSTLWSLSLYLLIWGSPQPPLRGRFGCSSISKVVMFRRLYYEIGMANSCSTFGMYWKDNLTDFEKTINNWEITWW